MATFRQACDARDLLAEALVGLNPICTAAKDPRLTRAMDLLEQAWAEASDLWQDLRPAPPGERIPDAPAAPALPLAAE